MNISEVRSKFPQYKDLSDKQLADALHEKFYSDIPLPEFYEQVGYSKKGLGAAVSKGAESLISQARTGISSLLGGSPEEAAKAGIARGKDIGERYAEQTSLDKVIKAYREKGILPAAGEAISQVPAALAEQAPNIAALAGTARAGAALGSLAGPVGTVVGGLAGAAIPSLLTQFGGNIERQAEEQTARGEPIKISREKAGAAAVPQAALDVAGSFIPLGGRLVSKLTGIPEKALLGGGANAAKLAEEKLLTTLAKGTATGALAEIPTEVAQQMLERSQAGLSLTDEDALKEYGRTAYQVGLLAPMGAAGRLSERGGARQQVEQEKQIAQRKARMEQMAQEEEAQRVQAEEAAKLEAHKQTPKYATEFVNNYEALDKQFQDLKAIKNPGSGASFEEIDAYKAARAQIKEIGKQLAEQVGEYRRVKGAAQQAAEQRYANIEQQAAQEVPQGPTQQEYYQSAQGTLPGMEPVEVPEKVKPPEQVEDENKKKVVEFAQKQQELERLLEAHQEQESNAVAKKDYDEHEKLQRQGNLLRNEQKYVDEQLKELGGYKNPQEIQNRLAKKEAEFADMAGPAYDPEKAKKLREEIQALKKEAGQEQLGFDFGPKREFKNQFVESKEAFKARAYEPGPQEIEDQEREYLDNVRKQEDEATAEAERNAKLAPERNAMMRMQERRGPFTLPTGQVSTQVDKLVDSILTSKGQTDKLVVGRVMEGMGAERVSQADSLRAQLSYALTTNNSTRAQEIRKQLADLREPDTEQGAGQLEIGLLAKETGVEGKQTPDTIRANRATRLAQAQLTAFDRLAEFVKRIREDSVYRSDARIQTLRNAAERLKDTVIGLALNEIDAKRVIAKLPPLSTKEKTDAVGNLEQVLTELIERGAGIFEPLQVKTTQAQMRANKVVRGAEEEISRAPLGQRVFNNYDAAAKALRSQMRDAVDEASGIEAPAPREQGNAKVTKVTPILKTQFQGQTRSTEQQFEAALNRASEEDTTQLELLQKYFKNLSPESQDLALEQVRRVENGLTLEMPRQLAEDLKDMRGAVADEGAQNELFPGASEKGVTRTTSKRFMNFLSSGEVNKLRASIAEDNRQAEFQAKRAATIARKIEEEQKRIDAYNKKLEESKKTPVEAARATLTKISAEDSPVTVAIKVANSIREQRTSARQRISGMVADLEATYLLAKNKMKELDEGLDYISQQLLLKPSDESVRKGFEFVIKDVKKYEKAFNGLEKSLEQARATQKRVLEEQASNTIDNALINEGEKAARKLEAAKDAVRKAQSEETVAKNKAETAREAAAMPAKEPGTPTISTILERTPGDNKTIVIRDTLDPAVQRKVKGLRGAIAKYESAYEEARIEGDKEGMEAAAKAVENSYNEVYDALNNAPQKITRTDELSRKEQEAMEEFDEAQRATLEATMKQMYEESGIRPLKLSTRKVEGVVKTKTGRVQTAIKQPSVAEQEKQATFEKAEGKVTPLEQIAVKKVELAAAQKQIDYIANNPSATAEGRKKQATAKKEAIAKRNDAKEELRKLTIEQQTYVKDAKLNKEAAKATFKEERKILKNAEKAPEVQLQEDLLDKDIELSRGSTDNPSTVSIVNQELKKHFRDLNRIKIYVSVEALIQSNPQYKKRIPSDARGFVDTAGNKVFLIAENINQGQALGVLLHEVGAHVGLKNILGKEQYDTLSSTIESWAKRNDNSIESRIAKEAIARVKEANTPASQRSDEILAYAVEEAVKAGVTPNKTKGTLGEWLSKIADSFRKLLQKFGMRPESLDAQGLVDMAFGAAQMEMQPIPSGMSRRAFLRGAVAAVGGMQLPAVNMGMSLDAKAKLFNATLDAADSWFSTAIGMAKTPALRNIVKQYSFDIDNDVFAEALYNADSDIEGKESLYSHLHWESYGNGDSTESLIDLLKSKPDAVEKLQTAVLNVRSQLVAAIDKLPKKENGEIAENELPEVGELLFSVKPKYVSAELAAAGHIADQFVAKQKDIKQRVQAASGGWLGLETQFVDRFAGFEKLSKLMEPLRGSQMMFYLRMYDQRMNFVAQSVARGAPQIVEKIRADGKKEYLIEATEGDSLKGVVETLKEATPLVGNGEAVNRLFTLYMSAVRAKAKGIGALNFNGRVTEAELAAAVKAVENTPGLKKIFEAARHEYNGYNKNLINFLVQTGAISKEHATNLLKENDYIPWYRQRNGVAELIIGSETPVRIGSIAEQPYLQELVGGDEPILDFMTSSVQNTNMLADMGLRNLATKNAVFELANMGLAKIGGGRSTSGPDVVKFKDNGQDKYALIDTDQVGIPADILVKGMEGIPTQMPAMMRLLAAPAQLLRKAVTLSPLYAAKQLFRDSVAAPLLAGADFTPVMGAIREIGSPTKETLEKRGVTGGQIFTGTSEDLTRILKDITAGKSNWSQLVAKAEAINMEADAATRRAQYNSYIKQGLSEMEATLMSLESMNFNKRGASPSVHWANAMIPFFNAQIQSMNVLYKALTGKLPFNERLKIQEKLLTRGLMLAAGTLAYASMMQDDEAYKNATPDQKYGNWFIRIPGVDEPIRFPIPFEIGYIFKALPEALYNAMKNKHGGEEAVKAFEQILLQTIPGGTSYGIPQALRPAIEAGLGKSFYTGRDTLTPHEAAVLPEYQFRTNTTEVSKMVGKVAGVSPIKLDELIRGYTGTMGLAFAQAVSMGIPKGEAPEKAFTRLSETPVVGGLFQPNDAGGIITSVYDKLADLKKLETTVDDLITKGEKAEAMRLVQTRSNDYMMASMSDYYTSTMRDLTAYENAIRATNLSGEDKRSKLDEVRQMKIRFANTMRENLDKTTRQSALP